MKKLVLLVILAFSLVLSPLATTMASTPKLINYQGKLKNLPAQSGPFLVVFEIFEDAAGGTALWIEQQNVTPSADGTFSTYLGETNPIDLKFDKQYYVQVTVGNNQPFPRTKLTSAPSAFHAIDADSALYAFESGLAMDVVPNVLTWDNMTADAQIAMGDLMGTYPNPQIRPDAILDNIPDGSITTEMLSPNISTSPSGPAGGDLTGTYPDPLIAVGAVKTDRIADGAVTNEKIANLTIADAKIVDLDAAKLFNLGALSGTVAVMTDATIDGDGTNAMPLGLADDAVTSAKIADGEVMTADLMDDAVTNEKLADDAVMSANIMDGEVMNADLAVDAVMSTNIMDGQVMTADLMDAAVTNAKLAVDAVRMENIDVNGGAPTDGEFLSWDNVDGEMRWVEPTVMTSAPLTGDGTTADPVTLDPTFGNENELLIRDAAGWTSGLINTANIADDAVGSDQIADDAIMTNHIMDGQVMTADLMDGAVNSAKILDESIATIDLMDASVTSVKIADDAIMTNHIMDGQVMTADLMDNAVTTGKILDGEVMTADLMDGAVTTAKLADNSVTTGKILDGEVNTADLANAAVTTVKIDDSAVTNSKIADLAVTNEKVSSAGQPQGKIMKADGSGGVSWEDDEGLILPWTGSYDGPGDAFTLTHTGIAGNFSAAVFNSTSASNTDPTVEIIKDVDDGAGSALAVRGLGVEGANYIATFTNNNLNEGRTVLIQNEAPATSNGGTLFDPGTPGDAADDYVNPDPAGTDVQDAALVVNNTDPSASGQKLAIKTYGSIQANSAIQGVDLISHNGEIIVYDGVNPGATLFMQENSFEKTGAVDETLQMFNTNGDFDVDLDGDIDVRNQAFIGDATGDVNQTTVRGNITTVTIDLSNPGVPNVSPAGPGTATTVATANADLLVDGDAELSGSLNLGGGADTYNSVNDIYISTDLTTLNPPLPAPPTTVIFESNDAQLISARAVEDALLNHDLQVAYNNGNSITSTDGQGDIDFNLEEATDFTITGANVGNDVIIDGAGYLDAQVNIINRAPGTAVIVEDDLEPQADNTFDLGSDVNRWQDAYVNGGSVHVGPTGGQAAVTELAIGYGANSATLNVDGGDLATLAAGADQIWLNPDGSAGIGTQEVIIDAAADQIWLDPNGNGTQEVIVNSTAGQVLVNADDAGSNELTIDGTADQIWLDPDGNGTNEVIVNSTANQVLVNADDAGSNELTIDGTADQIWLDANGDGNNEVTVNPAAGVTIDGNSNGNNNVNVTGTTFGVNADGLNGNEIFANASAVHLNANGDANIDVDVNGTTVDLDPNSNGTDNFSFAETGVTISTTQATGDVVLSDAGVNSAAAQEFAFTATAGNMDVAIDGKIDVQAAASTIGDNANGNQLTVEGVATAVVVDGAGLVTAAPAAGDQELTVTGDVVISGAATLGGNSVNDIFISTDLVGGLFPLPPASSDAQLVTALAVQQALLNHDLQVAYNNGNQIVAVDAEGDIDFDMTEATDFTVNLATANNNVVVDGAGIIDAQVDIENTAGDVRVDDNLVVTGTSDLQGAISNTVAGVNPVTVNDVDGLLIQGGILDAQAPGNLIGNVADVQQLQVQGVPTATTTDAAGAVTAAPNAANTELDILGDVNVAGSAILGGHSVDNIFVQGDLVGGLFPAPVAIDGQSNDGELVTALAVQTALLNHDLQVAYNNGNAITAVDLEGDIDFNMTEATDFTVNLATANNDVVIDGLGIIDAQVDIENSATGTVIVDDNLDVRDALFNNSIDATPLAINDDVTVTMQDANDNFEINSASTNGPLVDINKNGGDNVAAVEVETNEVGINVTNSGAAINAVAFSTSLAGGNAIGANIVTTGANAKGVIANSGAGTALQGDVTSGTAVQATATTGNAVTASNNVSNVNNPTVSVNNSNVGSNSYGVQVENGHMSLSSDNGAAGIVTGGTISLTSNTIVRLTTAGVNANAITFAAGSLQGQVIIVTNEDAGDINITAGTLGSQTVEANSAAQFVWNGAAWIIMD
ncbi:MAG: beta strand repeat-containing protein [Chlorobiota bacterium]